MTPTPFTASRLSTTSVLAEFSVGVEEKEYGQLLLMPNPARDRIMLRAQTSILEAEIRSIDGRLILLSNVHDQQVELDIAGLSAGSYCALVHLTDGTTLRSRFIKQ